MQMLVYPIFTSGTVLVQFGTGTMDVSQARLVEEYVPLTQLGPCLAFMTMVGQLSTLVGLISAEWIPDDNDVVALKENESWRLVQGLQLIVFVIILIYLLTLVRYDSPKFYVTQKQDEQAKKVIRKIYKTDGAHGNEDQILGEIKSLSSVDSNDVGIKDAFFTDEKYRRSSWIAILLSASVWLCGY